VAVRGDKLLVQACWQRLGERVFFFDVGIKALVAGYHFGSVRLVLVLLDDHAVRYEWWFQHLARSGRLPRRREHPAESNERRPWGRLRDDTLDAVHIAQHASKNAQVVASVEARVFQDVRLGARWTARDAVHVVRPF
jgi:hypothetical protein